MTEIAIPYSATFIFLPYFAEWFEKVDRLILFTAKNEGFYKLF